MVKMTDWGREGQAGEWQGNGVGRGANGGEKGGKGVVKYGGNGSN